MFAKYKFQELDLNKIKKDTINVSGEGTKRSELSMYYPTSMNKTSSNYFKEYSKFPISGLCSSYERDKNINKKKKKLSKKHLPLNQLIFRQENFNSSVDNENTIQYPEIQTQKSISKEKKLSKKFSLRANTQKELKSSPTLKDKSIDKNNLNTRHIEPPRKEIFNTQIRFNSKKQEEKFTQIYRKGITDEEIQKLSAPSKIQNVTSKKFEKENTIKKETFEDEVTAEKIFVNLVKTYQSVGDYSKSLIQQNIKNLNKQITLKYKDNFQLTNPDQFSDKYKICYDAINLENEEFDKMLKKVKNLMSSNFKLKEDIENEINRQKFEYKMEKRNEIRRMWKRLIITAAVHFKRLNLSLEEFYDKKYLTLRPYEKEGSIELIQAIKEGHLQYVSKLLKDNKLLVHNFDYFNQTPLHWAAKRDQYHIIPTLLRFGARIDAEDYSGRTALHIASEYNNVESVKILLYELATPFKRTHDDKLPIDMTNNLIIKFYLERAKNLHIINRVDTIILSAKRIKQGFKFFFDFGDNSLLKELIMGDHSCK